MLEPDDAALLRRLLLAAQDQAGQGLALAALAKRWQQPASVLLRRLTALSEARLGQTQGPGWLRLACDEAGRWRVFITAAGHAAMAAAAPLPPALVQLQDRGEWVAEEVPVALEFNGISQAVMLATPLDLEDFALGFALSEGLLQAPEELLDLELAADAHPAGLTLRLSVSARCEARLKERRRSLAGRTGCGLCGTDSLDQLLSRPLPSRPLQVPELAPQALDRAMRELAAAQTLQQRCGGLHAAAWCALDGAVLLLREDVGRHNALDKLIGALARAGTDPTAGFVAVTSRASFEMVQKSAAAGIGLLAAASAPTYLAIRTAQAAGLTLAGFVREGRATFYS